MYSFIEYRVYNNKYYVYAYIYIYLYPQTLQHSRFLDPQVHVIRYILDSERGNFQLFGFIY